MNLFSIRGRQMRLKQGARRTIASPEKKALLGYAMDLT